MMSCQAELANEQSGRSVGSVDEFGSELYRGVGEGPFGQNAPTDTPARFQHNHLMPCLMQVMRGGESGCASADDDGIHEILWQGCQH
jgi:hypothetical protein